MHTQESLKELTKAGLVSILNEEFAYELTASSAKKMKASDLMEAILEAQNTVTEQEEIKTVVEPVIEPETTKTTKTEVQPTVTIVPPADVEDPLAKELAAALVALADKHDAKSKQKGTRAKLEKPATAVKGKSLQWDEVWPASAIGSIKRDSFNGKVILKMIEGGVKLDDYEKLGLPTKRQVSQALACISEKGYGVVKADNVYTLVLPEGMKEPKLA